MNENFDRFTALRLGMAGGIARITLTEGERGNPFDAAFCSDLEQVAKVISSRSDVRVIVFEAEGPAFSFGGDLKTLTQDRASFVTFPAQALPQLSTALTLLRACDAPLVAAIHGVAAGGGLGLVCACDFILASSAARFVAAFSGIGLSADTGVSYFLPRRVGLTRASAFLMLNQSWSAGEAQSHGLVTSVHEPESLAQAVDDLASRLAAGPTLAYGDLKRLLDGAFASSLAEQLGAEAVSINRLCQSEDSWGAMHALLAKRKPVFEGR